jgi:hypothetical protein
MRTGHHDLLKQKTDEGYDGRGILEWLGLGTEGKTRNFYERTFWEMS